MAALHALPWPDDGPGSPVDDAHNPDDNWLTLPQAACEMGVSISTVRRQLRDGRLRNRIVPRRGGFKYLIYMPDNRHARTLHRCENGDLSAPIDIVRVRQQREIGRLQRQVEELSGALSRALRSHQQSVPLQAAIAVDSQQDPYARYRWLVRKRRWWPFD
jgi:hypothetical protein